MPHPYAKQEQAEIHWGDETGIRNDNQNGRSYAPRGQTPVIRLSAKRASMNIISTVTNQGKVRFMIYRGIMNAQRLFQFFNQLIKTANKKIFLILDSLRIHHAKLVNQWLAKKIHAQKIEVLFLPAYSPEMNPGEYLNSDLKLVCMPSPRSGIRPHLSKTIMRTRVCYNTPQIA